MAAGSADDAAGGSDDDAVVVVDAFAAGLERDASHLLFEYMAATRLVTGHGDTPAPHQLPPALRDECLDPRATYRPPGTVILALAGGQAVGVVGLKVLRAARAEVKRLWVTPSARGRGIGRQLMESLHERAASLGLSELILDVMPSRTSVIDLYRTLGYLEYEPRREKSSMVYMRRDIRQLGDEPARFPDPDPSRRKSRKATP